MADASLVAKYVNLQSVEVPSNEITDLSSLSSLKHLTHLDASHNKLTEVRPAQRIERRGGGIQLPRLMRLPSLTRVLTWY